MDCNEKLVPFGVLNLSTNESEIIFGTSSETSDFIVDSLETWWDKNHDNNPDIKTLVINLDNGPQISSNRTQFLKRMVEFSNKINRVIHLVYYPPYHSKYNPIERYWGNLECHWNGQLLDSVHKAVAWASSMTWKGIKATISVVNKIYEKGVSLSKGEMEKYQSQMGVVPL